MTVAVAADGLGITKEAVRKRISRRTLRSVKAPDGTQWVYVPPSGTSSDTVFETMDRNELVELLRVQLEDLRADQDAWRDQARRSDYLASTAMDRPLELEKRLRELESPTTQEPPEAPVTVEEGPEGRYTSARYRRHSGGHRVTQDRTRRLPQELIEAREQLEAERSRSSWWRRIFGG